LWLSDFPAVRDQFELRAELAHDPQCIRPADLAQELAGMVDYRKSFIGAIDKFISGVYDSFG
jgi:hypothetical protein